jgi:glycosyltransferase involved in cell wall biosynthesis
VCSGPLTREMRDCPSSGVNRDCMPAASDPLRIAQVAPLLETVPPRQYGGTERVIYGLTEHLIALGHDVTLFAAGGSHTSAKLVAAAPAPFRYSMARQALVEISPHLHLQMLADIYRRAHEFDVIHAHTDIWTLPFVRLTSRPTVLTLHGRLDLDVVQRVFPLYSDATLVSISDSQRAPLDHFPIEWAATVPNGLILDDYLAARRTGGGYLAFIGRITPEKRPDWAAEIAQRAGVPLKVAAKVDPVDIDYWNGYIEPLFRRRRIEYLGEISEREKPAYLAGAHALVFPIDWPEPFGLVMIEALAAGTPVVALRRGSVEEILIDGENGYICDTIDEMVDAVRRIVDGQGPSPQACRARAAQFSAEAMTQRYLEVYRKALAAHASRQRPGRTSEFIGASGGHSA